MAKGTKILNSAIKVNDRGDVFLNLKGSEPDDGSISNGELVLWFDGGSSKVKAKMRMGASVLAGDVATLA